MWEGAAALLRKANAQHVAAASDALDEAGRLMERVPVDDRAGWARLTSDAAGVLAAAAAATPNVVLQRELTRAWEAVNRCVRPSEPEPAGGSLLAGASRVLMALRMSDDPGHVQVAALIALIAQAAQLASQLARTAAARADATAAERRAVAACQAAAQTASRPAPAASMWQYPPRSPAEAVALQETQTPIEQAPGADRALSTEPGLDR